EAGTNGPYGLVRDEDAPVEPGRGWAPCSLGGKHPEDLPEQHRLGSASLAFLARLAHAYGDLEPFRESPFRAKPHGLVRLAEKLPALRVAGEHLGDADLLEHGSGNLAGEGAGFFPVDVLCADPNPMQRE